MTLSNTRFTRTTLVFTLTLLCGWQMVTSLNGEEIGVIEELAISEDREAVLSRLIPGSEEYYYYHCLNLQHTEQFDEAAELLKLWIERRGRTAGATVMERRQALLTYPKTPAKTLQFLKSDLGLNFAHQRQEIDPAKNLPGALDPKLISRERLKMRALSGNNDLDRFTDAALDWLVFEELSPERRRSLLQRLSRPDYDNLVDLVAADLEFKRSSGFGGTAIHNRMMKSQLDALLKKHPGLLNRSQFVNNYLAQLQPNPDEAWEQSAKARREHLNRLWLFVKRLSPSHNSLKAHVLYHFLELDLSEGVYDKERFMQYIRLPRHAHYMDTKYMELEESRRYAFDLSADFESFTLLKPIGNDDSLVSAYLQHFFLKEATYDPYIKVLGDEYLKRQFAEAKILNGLGNEEEWASLLSPSEFQNLKERIDLEFAATNPKTFAVDDEVVLDLYVKNADSVIVKVYEVNAFNYFRENNRKVDTSISLDGLAANYEQSHRYDSPALRRVKRTYRFPELKGAGVFVIDFIGNGKSSRAVVRKGQLTYLVETNSAGHRFLVFDENRELRKNASIWLGGHEFTADRQGQIQTPFSSHAGRQTIILRDGQRTSLDSFQQRSEEYALQAGFYVDRESLLPLNAATLVVRPGLRLNNEQVSLSLCEQPTLTITATDLNGVSTSKVVENFELYEDRESEYDFQTPLRLASVTFQLTAKVKSVSRNQKVTVSASESFSLNGISPTDKIEDLHLLTFANKDGSRNYEIELLGKSGEPLAGRAVHLTLQHRDFTESIQVALQTNAQGRVKLGGLPDIRSLNATSPQGVSLHWQLLGDRVDRPRTIHAGRDGVIYTPYLGEAEKPLRNEVSLLELRGGRFVADHFDALEIADGYLRAEQLPPGDYDLFLKDNNQHILFQVTDGKEADGLALGNHRFLELGNSVAGNAKPLQIQTLNANDQTIKIQLGGNSKFTRVHLFATRYAPAYDPYTHFARIDRGGLSTRTWRPRRTSYAQGRDIGDEYRYILERQYAAKFPGNMLKRPSLLLNPWALRSTETGTQQSLGGDDFAPETEPGYGGGAGAEPAPKPEPAPDVRNFSNLDFLGSQSVVALNLEADDEGVIEIDRELLGWRQHLHVVAVDPENTVYRELALPLQEAKFVDQRLKNGLDPELHFTQQKQISLLGKGQKFELADVSSSRFEAYDSLASVYRLYSTLSNDAKLREFGFILNWPELKDEEKREKYSEFACHELNFFLFHKDKKFFAAVVKPYLANKKDKTYLDHWLLDQELKGYLELWRYQRLNIAERVLLGRKLASERKAAQRHIADLLALQKPNTDQLALFFESAVLGNALDTDDSFGWNAEKKLAELSDKAKGNKEAFDLFGAVERPQEATEFESKDSRGERSKYSDEKDRKARQLGDLMKRGGSKSDEEDEEHFFSRESRDGLSRFYIRLEETKEWVENNYYQLPIEQQLASLIDVNPFWRDYIEHEAKQPFLSGHFSEAGGNFSEMMFALAVLDLPFVPAEHKTEFAAGAMTLTPGGPMVVFHEEILATTKAATETPILVSQNFYRYGDRYRHEGNERFDKFVADEFLIHTVYGCQVVVTNPTSSPRKLDLLTQIPLGSLPVLNGKVTENRVVHLDPYSTTTFDYYFYFPASGEFTQYPVHIAKSGELVAHAANVSFKVVKELSKVDRTSWDYVSQFGTDAEVIEFLRRENLHRVNLDRIAFRLRDKAFYQRVVNLLQERHIFNATLWQYSVHHNDRLNIQQYLSHSDGFVSGCGPTLESPLLTIEPVERYTYQHRDYRPLVNARAHQLGRRRQILNDRFHHQYHELLAILAHQPKLDDADQMAVLYYLLLQDRVEESLALFEKIQPNRLKTRLQYDYFAAYLDFYTPGQEVAEEIALRYADHPVDRWRKAFATVTAQLKEAAGGGFELVDQTDRNQDQANLAASAPSFDFAIDGREVTLEYQNIDRVQVNYYLMDIELLFSRNPFVQQHSGKFSYIRPNASDMVELPTQKSQAVFALPAELRNRNVLVEIVGDGISRTHAHYSNSLAVQVIDNYGQVKVFNRETEKPLSKVYVKVYAELGNGQIAFYKDGYTDIRGRFDYSSLNTGEIDSVKRFSLLILSPDHGAVVREAKPPQQ